MATVSTLATFASLESAIREYTGLATGYAATLERLLGVAATEADAYIGRDDYAALTSNVVEGLLCYIKHTINSTNSAGISTEVTGEVSVSYDTVMLRGKRSVAEEQAAKFWHRERLDWWR